jgi:hypothetical protein
MSAQNIRARSPISALAFAAAAIAIGAAASPSRAQVAADHCVDAPLIVGNHQYYGTTNNATSDIFQSPCSDSDSYDVWYRFDAGIDGDYAIDTLFSQIDTTLAVYDACGGNLLGCNDDVDPDNFEYTSLVTLPLSAGQSIRIRVAGYGGDTGPFALYITTPTPTATMGACCRGSACAVESSDLCTGAGALYAGADVACNAPGNATLPCCRADFNHNGAVEIQDIFDFLNAWFLSDPRCDINVSGGVEIQDIFDFLNAWFAGC